MKKYTVEELENLSEEEVEKIAKEIIGEQQSGMAASIDGVIFVFNAVNKFEVSDQKLYLNVIHPEGAMYMDVLKKFNRTIISGNACMKTCLMLGLVRLS